MKNRKTSNGMGMSLSTEKYLFLFFALSLCIFAIVLLIDGNYFIGILLGILAIIIIGYYLRDYLSKKHDIDSGNDNDPNYQLFSPCKM